MKPSYEELETKLVEMTATMQKHCNLRVMWRTRYSEEVRKLQQFQDEHICYRKKVEP